MRGLAPSISSMWSAAVETPVPPPSAEDAAMIWAFAIRTADTAFEWQVRDVLASLEGLPAVVAAGPTFEERDRYRAGGVACVRAADRSEEHTSELQSLMRNSYAVFRLKKKNSKHT